MRLLSVLLCLGLLSGGLMPIAEARKAKTPVVDETRPAPAILVKPTKVNARLEKREMVDAAMLPALEEIRRLKWEVASDREGADESEHISLEKIFGETLEHSIVVRQAEAQIKSVEAQAKEIRDPGLFNLLNPLLDTGALKKAAEGNIQAARHQLTAARQKALLESARMHADLTQAFLGKYLAYQAIEQGRSQLKADEQRFFAGEINSFDLSQTQMALIDRYGKYLNADNTYHAASVLLARHIDVSPDHVLIPEGYVLSDGEATVSPLSVVPAAWNLEQTLKAARSRPEILALQQRRDALVYLVKAAAGLDKEKKQAELRHAELELEKAETAAAVMAEKAYGDYQTANRNAALARQRFELANRFVRQLQISQEAGFSSSKDLLEGQIELAKARTALISAQVAYNLSQLQLVYEMGLLGKESLSHPLAAQ